MSTTNTDAPATRRHWSTKARLILAGVAVLGVGAAVTTAAWTDEVWFEAEASSSEALNLQGSVDGGTVWEESPSETEIELTIPPTAFENLSQGAAVSYSILVRNAGAADGQLDTWTATGTGAIFSGADPASVAVAPATPAAPPIAIAGSSAQEIEFIVTVTTPADWDPVAYAGQTGAITVTVTGTSA